MMGTKARLGICAAAATLAVTAVAGCSGSGGSGGASGAGAGSGDSPALSLVADAMNKANSESTVRMTGTTSVKGETTQVSGEARYSPSVEMSMTTQINGQSMSIVYLGETMYMNYPELAPELDGKSWGEIDLANLGGKLGSLSSILASAKSYNPVSGLEAMIASGKVTKVGTATVDGQQTTEYSGSFTAAELAQLGTSGSNLTTAQASDLKQLFSQEGLSSESIEVWVASSGLPVEERTVTDAAGATATAAMYFSDWGQPVQIGAPPASEVYNMTGELSSAGATAGSAG
jgi:hypothetical protein